MSNFYLPLSANANYFPKSDEAKVNSNIKIIKLVKQLNKEKKQADPKQQAEISRYVGWGGLANTFFNESDLRFKTQRKELKQVVSSSEYEAMKASSLTAYYTDPLIARAMWQQVVKQGITKGNILDPSMGTGMFFMTMPKEIRDKVNLYGIELDQITGLIAKQLFPEANIYIKGFQNVNFKDADFDLVISNIPFGNIRLLARNGKKAYYIHDYFLKKSLEVVRNYGLVAIISSTGLMDKRTRNIFKDIKRTTNFLGGVRLPNCAFKKIAGTDVTTDMLFFQKDELCKLPRPLNKIINEGSQPYAGDTSLYVSNYFISEPQQILGMVKVENFNGKTFTVVNQSNFMPQLYQALKNILPAKNVSKIWGHKIELEQEQIVDQSLPKNIQKLARYEFGYYKDDVFYHKIEKGQDRIIKNQRPETLELYVNRNDKLVSYISSPKRVDDYHRYAQNDKNVFDVYLSNTPTVNGKFKDCYKKIIFFYVPYSRTEKERIIGLTKIKEDYLSMIEFQRNHSLNEDDFAKIDQFKAMLNKLNNDYDTFVKNFGKINSVMNKKYFDEDKRFPLLESLEDKKLNDATGKINYVKSLAFYEPLVAPITKHLVVKTALDALLTSVSNAHGVDFDYMKSIYPNHDTDEIKRELGDQILIDVLAYSKDNTVKYVTKSEMLSGDVVTKYEIVEKLIKDNDDLADWRHYQSLLKQVMPVPLAINDITFRLASDWIPDDIVTNFIYDELYNAKADYFSTERPERHNLVVRTKIGRKIDTKDIGYIVNGEKARQYKLEKDGDVKAGYSNAISIIDYLIDGKQPVIKEIVDRKPNGKPVYKVDLSLTNELREIENKLEKLFENYVLSNDKLSKEIEKVYNKQFNRYVNRTYDGSHMEIDGLAKNYQLRDYQKNAVERIVETQRALLAHEVGTGKTLTMISAGFKLKDLGIIHRPLFVVPTNLTSQFGSDILKFYPTRNVLVTSEQDFKKENRRRFLAKIITSDFDAIVIGHSQFEKIKVDLEVRKAFIADKLSEIERNLERIEDKWSIKALEKSKENLKTKLAKLAINNQDDFLSFEDLGIDFLFVDEAHNYKNMAPISYIGDVKGINRTTSQRSLDMQLKIKLLHRQFHNTHVVFATGTPVSNSISEMWIMMQYIEPDVLAKFGIEDFDVWARTFGLIKNNFEVNPTGDKIKAQKRFIKFVNLPELMKIYKISTDIQMADQLNLKLPKSKSFVITSNLTNAQKEKLEELVDRSDEIQRGNVDPKHDNMLKITSEARKLTLDMRLLDSGCTREDSAKLSQVVDNVYRIYKRTDAHKGTQTIFSDLGTPSSSRKFNVYDEIKQMLIERGIPKDEIAFMHSATNSASKIELERKMNAGEIRVLIASTQKGGTGLNIQHRMKAVHHLDVPWRPSDIIQRNGRVVRQGNIWKEVEIYHYVTNGSFDNYLWQIQESKLKFITQIMTSKTPIRAMKDIDSHTLTASEIKALATGKKYLKLQMLVKNKLMVLQNRKNDYERNHSARVSEILFAKESLKHNENSLSVLKMDNEVLEQQGDLKDNNIVFAQKPTSYTTFSDVNNRLRYEVRQMLRSKDYFASEGKYVIGTFAGFEISLKYNDQKRVYERLTGANYLVTRLYLTGNNIYEVELKTRDLSFTNIYQKIRNTLNDIPKDVKKVSARIFNQKRLINQGTGSNTFPQQEELDYIYEKNKLLTDLMSADASNEKVKDELQKLDAKWGKSEATDVKTKDASSSITQNDPNDYNDEIFEEDNQSDVKTGASLHIVPKTKPQVQIKYENETKSKPQVQKTNRVKPIDKHITRKKQNASVLANSKKAFAKKNRRITAVLAFESLTKKNAQREDAEQLSLFDQAPVQGEDVQEEVQLSLF